MNLHPQSGKSFDLETGNTEEAAAKARDIHLSLIAKDWAATLADLKPKATQPIEIVVGERGVYWFETVDFEKMGSMKLQAPGRLPNASEKVDVRKEASTMTRRG